MKCKGLVRSMVSHLRGISTSNQVPVGGEWPVASSQKRVPSTRYPVSSSFSRLGPGHWLLVTEWAGSPGYWELVTGYWVGGIPRRWDGGLFWLGLHCHQCQYQYE